MSELINANANGTLLRKRLLSTACCAAILTAVSGEAAIAESADRPTVWIELGGQLERMANSQKVFDPPFVSGFDHLSFDPVLPLQRPSLYSNGEEGSISFQPKGSNWVFSASARYGRANGSKAINERLPKITWQIKKLSSRNQFFPSYQAAPYYIDASSTSAEQHLILDFQAGKDVGLGIFGNHASSFVSAGIRIAQMTSRSANSIGGVPDFYYRGNDDKYGGVYQSHHRYSASADVKRSFQGIGPTLSWKAFAPLVRESEDTQISLDWGLNVGALFGRQKVSGSQDVNGLHYSQGFNNSKHVNFNHIASSYNHPADLTRSRSVIVPNVGAFAGLSFRYADAKLSLGYRADMFFGAMDGGLETRKTYDRDFYGPFATISIGLGG